MSLRSAALDRSMAESRAGLATPGPNSGHPLGQRGLATALDRYPYSSVFLAMGMGSRPQGENLVCSSCLSHLHPSLPSKRTDEPGSCKLCAYREAQPEAFTKPYLDFMTANPTVFHAVDYFKEKLNSAGFQEVRRFFFLGPKPCQTEFFPCF